MGACGESPGREARSPVPGAAATSNAAKPILSLKPALSPTRPNGQSVALAQMACKLARIGPYKAGEDLTKVPKAPRRGAPKSASYAGWLTRGFALKSPGGWSYNVAHVRSPLRSSPRPL